MAEHQTPIQAPRRRTLGGVRGPSGGEPAGCHGPSEVHRTDLGEICGLLVLATGWGGCVAALTGIAEREAGLASAINTAAFQGGGGQAHNAYSTA